MVLLCIVEFLLMVILAIDTLGFIVQNRKNTGNTSQQDYLRTCFNWVFFLTLNSLTCSSGGYIAGIFNFFLFLVKVYVSIPMLRGTEKLYTLLIEENAAKHYFAMIANMIKEKTGSNAESQ